MNRRACLKTIAVSATAGAVPSSAAVLPMQMHIDLRVDPARLKEAADNYHRYFRPAIAKQPGFVDSKFLKLRSETTGKIAAGVNHRLIISFQTEEQRRKWAATAEHKTAWGSIEKTLVGDKYSAVIFDPV